MLWVVALFFFFLPVLARFGRLYDGLCLGHTFPIQTNNKKKNLLKKNLLCLYAVYVCGLSVSLLCVGYVCGFCVCVSVMYVCA